MLLVVVTSLPDTAGSLVIPARLAGGRAGALGCAGICTGGDAGGFSLSYALLNL